MRNEDLGIRNATHPAPSAHERVEGREFLIPHSEFKRLFLPPVLGRFSLPLEDLIGALDSR
jgi:hypothetical protein